ncbi:hypothetical protein B0H11DRAFT_2076206 [Mycena galericulata]|nr:hypothetical protein B0H11DRAFT_2076206 [Mycena galericulata]
MNDDSDFDPGTDIEVVEDTPTTGGDKKLLDRETRSVCRALRAGGIDPADLDYYGGCSKNTIKRVILNDYKRPDNLEQDVLPADFADILRTVKSKYSVAGKEVGSTSTAKATNTRVRVPNKSATHRRKTRGSDATAAITSTNQPFKFLDAFVKRSLLGPEFVDVMRRGGWTEEKLRRIAGAPKGSVTRFLEVFAESLPNHLKLSDIDKFNLSLTIEGLAMAM